MKKTGFPNMIRFPVSHVTQILSYFCL